MSPAISPAASPSTFATLAGACLASVPPPPAAVDALWDATLDPAAAGPEAIPLASRTPLAHALIAVPRAERITALALLRTLTRLPQGTEALADPAVLSVLAADIMPLARFGPDTPHDWAIADSALRILNNVLLIHQDLRRPFADPPPLPGIGGAVHVLAILGPVASLLESIFFPHMGNPEVVAQHAEMLHSCMKPHAPGPRGATSALDAVFLSARVLFLSTVFRHKFNETLVTELDGLTSLRNVLSVLTRIRVLLRSQPDSEPEVTELVNRGLAESLRLVFNVSLYFPPQPPYLDQWVPILAIIVHYINDTVHNACEPDTPPTNSCTTSYSPGHPQSLYSGSQMSMNSTSVAPEDDSWAAAALATSLKRLGDKFGGSSSLPNVPLVAPLTWAINAMLNFPLGKMDEAWRETAKHVPMYVPSWTWRPVCWRSQGSTTQESLSSCAASNPSMSVSTGFTTSTTLSSAHGLPARTSSLPESVVRKDSGHQEPKPTTTKNRNSSSSASASSDSRRPRLSAGRFAAALLTRAGVRHVHPLKTRLHSSPSTASAPCAPPATSAPLEDVHTNLQGTSELPDLSDAPLDCASEPDLMNAPALPWTLLRLLESSLMRYFGPPPGSSSALGTESHGNVSRAIFQNAANSHPSFGVQGGMECADQMPSYLGPGDMAVRENSSVCLQDGIKDVEEPLVALISLLSKLADEADEATEVEEAPDTDDSEAQGRAQNSRTDACRTEVQASGVPLPSSWHECPSPGTAAPFPGDDSPHVGDKNATPPTRAQGHTRKRSTYRPPCTPVRRMLRTYFFPSTLDRTCDLRARSDFRGVLIRLFGASNVSYPLLKTAVGGMLLSAFDQDPQWLAQEVGIGTSIGFLMSIGLASGSTEGREIGARSKHLDARKEVKEGRHALGDLGSVNPVTSTTSSANAVPAPALQTLSENHSSRFLPAPDAVKNMTLLSVPSRCAGAYGSRHRDESDEELNEDDSNEDGMDTWDPITGTLRAAPRPWMPASSDSASDYDAGVECLGMSREEAAKEADRLMGIMERFNRTLTRPSKAGEEQLSPTSTDPRSKPQMSGCIDDLQRQRHRKYSVGEGDLRGVRHFPGHETGSEGFLMSSTSPPGGYHPAFQQPAHPHWRSQDSSSGSAGLSPPLHGSFGGKTSRRTSMSSLPASRTTSSRLAPRGSASTGITEATLPGEDQSVSEANLPSESEGESEVEQLNAPAWKGCDEAKASASRKAMEPKETEETNPETWTSTKIGV